MGVSGQCHAPATLYSWGEGPLVPIEYEDGRASELVWAQRPEEKSYGSARDQTPAMQSAVRLYTERYNNIMLTATSKFYMSFREAY
jgi:hypothetical protein